MYAIVETGGKQYRVRPGDTIAVERLASEPGETLDLDRVLLLGGDGGETSVGAPGVSGAVVRAEVVDHALGEKIIVFRYKSKVRYRRKTGHRQRLTRLRITDILVDGASAVPAQAEPAPEPAERPAPETGAPPAAQVLPETPAATAAAANPTTADEELPATAAEAGPPPVEAAAEDTTETDEGASQA
jgi:large subunit ribosomal protein L21